MSHTSPTSATADFDGGGCSATSPAELQPNPTSSQDPAPSQARRKRRWRESDRPRFYGPPESVRRLERFFGGRPDPAPARRAESDCQALLQWRP